MGLDTKACYKIGLEVAFEHLLASGARGLQVALFLVARDLDGQADVQTGLIAILCGVATPHRARFHQIAGIRARRCYLHISPLPQSSPAFQQALSK